MPLHFYDRGPDRPWRNPLLTSAAIVGHVTTSTARLWVRVWEPGQYYLLVANKPLPEAVEMTVSTSEAGRLSGRVHDGGTNNPLPGRLFEAGITFDTDLTHVFDVGELKPGSVYYYALLTQDKKKAESFMRWELSPAADLRQFRTQRENPKQMTFGLFSCHMPYRKNGDMVNLQMWERFREELETLGADFVIAGGDQVYTDGNDTVSIWRWLKKVKNDLGDDRN